MRAAVSESTEAAAVRGGRVPDFFIVGHAKCGTTALYEMLKRHPQIYMSATKEPQFFAADNPNPQTSRERSIAFTGRRGFTLEEYLSLFAGARPDQRAGEASTFYLWSKVAPGRIAAMQPRARIIAILREPASFLRSVHLQMLQNNAESETDFRKALELDDARRENRAIPRHAYWPQALIYSERVRYVEQLRRYHEAFSPDQVLVLIYDDFRRDNEATMREVLRFLEVDENHPIGPLEANPTVALRSKRFNQLRHTMVRGQGPIVQAVRATGKALTTERMRHALYYRNIWRVSFREPPPPDEGFMRELRERLKPEVVAVSDYLGRDLVTEWGYDAVG